MKHFPPVHALKLFRNQLGYLLVHDFERTENDKDLQLLVSDKKPVSNGVIVGRNPLLICLLVPKLESIAFNS